VPNDIQFIVKDGFVTLSGSVEWYFQAQEAASEARRVRGVRDVDNNIAMRERAVNADEIVSKIRSAFARLADAEASTITVSVDGATVTLTGVVRSLLERDRAAQVAWNAPGVNAVRNLIAVLAT
jgi:osmotically-inducible protein OsmY